MNGRFNTAGVPCKKSGPTPPARFDTAAAPGQAPPEPTGHRAETGGNFSNATSARHRRNNFSLRVPATLKRRRPAVKLFVCQRVPRSCVRASQCSGAANKEKKNETNIKDEKSPGGESSRFADVTKSGLIKLSALTAGLMLAACASVPPPPIAALKAAETAIATADRERVADHASPELNEARQNLTAARAAAAKADASEEDMVLAQRLAEQARVNAELATAKAESMKAKAVNDEMQKSIDTLKQEMQRNTGARP